MKWKGKGNFKKKNVSWNVKLVDVGQVAWAPWTTPLEPLAKPPTSRVALAKSQRTQRGMLVSYYKNKKSKTTSPKATQRPWQGMLVNCYKNNKSITRSARRTQKGVLISCCKNKKSVSRSTQATQKAWWWTQRNQKKTHTHTNSREKHKNKRSNWASYEL